MQLGWGARIMTVHDRFFFGVVEFEAYDQSLRSNLIEKDAPAKRKSFSVPRRGPRKF